MGRVGGLLLLWVVGLRIGVVGLHGGVMEEAVGQEVDCFDVGVFFGGLVVGNMKRFLGSLSTMLVWDVV
jgi:hypothetical protein